MVVDAKPLRKLLPRVGVDRMRVEIRKSMEREAKKTIQRANKKGKPLPSCDEILASFDKEMEFVKFCGEIGIDRSDAEKWVKGVLNDRGSWGNDNASNLPKKQPCPACEAQSKRIVKNDDGSGMYKCKRHGEFLVIG